MNCLSSVFSVRGRSLPNGTRDASHGCCSSSTITFVVFFLAFDLVDFLSLLYADVGVATSIAMEEDGTCGTTASEDDCATDPDGNNGAVEDSTLDEVDTEDGTGRDEALGTCVDTFDVDASVFVNIEDEEIPEVEAVEELPDVEALPCTISLIAACSSYTW